MKTILVVALLFFFTLQASGQILISLLLGDKLNAENIEFGIDGGLNFGKIDGISPGKPKALFNLGFYFDISLSEHFLLHTGLLPKSSMGMDGIKPYGLDDTELNNLFTGGTISRKINYLSLPVTLKYRFFDLIHIEAGAMLGIRTSAYDLFSIEILEKGDLTYSLDIRDRYRRLDAGILAGAGFRLNKKPKSTQIGIRYYHGVIDPLKENSESAQYNSSWYLYVSVPIGAGKGQIP